MLRASFRKLTGFAPPFSRRGRRPRRTAGFRPRIDCLEDRTLLDAVHWLNPAGGNWSTASNWDAGHVPGPADDAIIDIATTGPVTHSTGNDRITSLASTAAFMLSGGTLDVSGTVQVSNTFTLSSGTLADATVVAGTTLVATSGTLDRVTLHGGLDLTSVSGAQVTVSGGLTLNGTLAVGNAAGTTNGSVVFVGSQTVGGRGDILFGGSPSNALRIANSVPATVTLGPGLTVHGKSGALAFSISNMPAGYANEGAIVADVPGGMLSVNFSIGGGSGSNSGTLAARGGTLAVATGTWTHSGTLQAVNGGILSANTPTNFTNGTLTGGSWQVFADSTLRVTLPSGVVTNAADILLDGPGSNFYRDTGTTNALANFAVNAGGFTLRNGRNFTTAGDFTNAGTLTVGAGSTLAVTGNLTNFDGTTLNGGTYLLGGTLQFPGAAVQINAATLVLDGPAAQVVDPSGNDGLAPLTLNASAGSLTVQNGRTVTTTGDFTNLGTLTVGAGSAFVVSGSLTNFDGTTLAGGTYLLGGTFQFTGAAVQANAATLVLDGPAAQVLDETGADGLVSLAANTGVLILRNGRGLATSGDFTNSGMLTLGAGSTLFVGGSFAQTDGLTDLQGGSLDAAVRVDLNGGTFRKSAGFDTVTITAAFNNNAAVEVLSGTLSLAGGGGSNGGFSVAAGAVLDFTGGAYTLDASSGVSGAGAVRFEAGGVEVAGAYDVGDTAVVGGTVNFFGGAATGTFHNDGGAVLIGPAGALTVAGSYIQTAGSLTLAGGTLTAGGLVDLQGGVLAGAGTVNASVVNAAQINVGGAGATGLLSINGDYTQTDAGILNLELDTPEAFDQLAISGLATLNGILNVTPLDGFFTSEGDRFAVLTFGSRTGDFGSVNLPDLGDALSLDPQYDDTSLTLVTTARS